jgi:diguanylate cyclase (GGDEF)-like protein
VQARDVAEKIRLAVAGVAISRDHADAALTISIGVGDFPTDAQSARGLVDEADAALYQAKARGRDRVVVAGDA